MRELWPAFSLAAAFLLAGSLLAWLPARRVRKWLHDRRRPAPRPAPRVWLLLVLTAAGILLAAAGLFLALAAATAGTYAAPPARSEKLVALVTAEPTGGRGVSRMRLTYRPVERGLTGKPVEFALTGEEWGVRGDQFEWSPLVEALGFRRCARVTGIEARRAGEHPRARGRDVRLVAGGSDWLWRLVHGLRNEPLLGAGCEPPGLARARRTETAFARPRAGSVFRVYVRTERTRAGTKLIYRIEETRSGPPASGH